MTHCSTPAPGSTAELDELISRPDDRVLAALRNAPGDCMVIGAGGKMGFHVCRMLQRGFAAIGRGQRVFAVSRFRDAAARRVFDDAGIEVIACDAGEPQQLARLPDVGHLFFLAGVKFGTSDNPQLLQRLNVELPQRVAERFRDATIVALSTGCVYAMTTPASGGSREDSPTDPPGDYARSCLGREQAFCSASRENGTRCTLIRLNYSIDLHYGVLVDIAQAILRGEPVHVETGYVNVIWQGDAVSHIIQSLGLAAAPPAILNVTGSEVLSVRALAQKIAARLDRPLQIAGEESSTAWLSNAGRAHELFGAPRVSLDQMIDWTCNWLLAGRPTWNKPTHFEARSGDF